MRELGSLDEFESKLRAFRRHEIRRARKRGSSLRDAACQIVRDDLLDALGEATERAAVSLAAHDDAEHVTRTPGVREQHLEATGRAGRASAMGVVLASVTLVFAAIVFIVNRLAGGKERVQMA